MGKALNLTGRRFGRLVVIRREKNIGKHAAWLCLCDCGKTAVVRSYCLSRGWTKSCGCFSRESASRRATKHGGTKKNPRLYYIWNNIQKRCCNPTNTYYKNYGGRGITICNDWMDFNNFYKWAMSSGYSDNLTIDRIDNDGNYEPENCRWATRKTQNRNRRNNKFIFFNGATRTYAEWDEYMGYKAETIKRRKARGWSDERAITTIPKIIRKEQGR